MTNIDNDQALIAADNEAALVALGILVQEERDRCLDIICAEAEKHRDSPYAQMALGRVAHLIRSGAHASVGAREVPSAQP